MIEREEYGLIVSAAAQQAIGRDRADFLEHLRAGHRFRSGQVDSQPAARKQRAKFS